MMALIPFNDIRRWRSFVPWLATFAFVVTSTRGLAAENTADDLFTNGPVRHLQIEIADDGMKVLRSYHQVWGQPRPERVDVKATVRQGGAVYTNVAVHLKGSYTFEPVDEKPSLTLNFDKFAPGQRFHGLDKIHLNNSVQDPSYLCEKLAREMFVAAGVPAARVGHARVSLNGRALGFYVLVEGYNKRFVKRHFKSTKGNLYDGGSGGDITKPLEADSGDERENRADLAALAAATRDKNASNRLARLEQLLDVDRFLTFAALEVLFQHWDGYCLGPNNFRLFHDTDREKMIFMPHGLDQILGVGRSVPSSINPKWDGLVAQALFSTPEGRRRYVERLSQLSTNLFRAEVMAAKVDRMAARIRPVATDGIIGRVAFEYAVDGLKSRIQHRVQQVAEQLEKTEKPLAFDGESIARLDGWEFRQTGRAEISARRNQSGERTTLEVKAAGTWSSGSWRKMVLLEAGRYELSALARVAGLPFGATNSGVILRVSGEREAAGLVTNANWTPLRYEFETPGLITAELVCEFRGPAGSGFFDASSLQLRKVGVAAPRKQ
jgi:spore coat protein H